MIALPQRHTARLLLALALSLLLHATMLVTPTLEFPEEAAPPSLAPLTAKLEPLPQIASAPIPERSKPVPPPSPAKRIAAAPATAAPAPERATEDEPHARDLPATTEAIAQAGKPHPLPLHAQLT